MRHLLEFEKVIGFAFNNPELLKQAFVHRSYLNEHPDFPLAHNERLEFLGDAVLEMVVTEYLYQTFPNPEGELTNWRASLVNAKTLSEIAANLGMDDYMYLSRGEEKDKQSKARQIILANAIEAVVGAIYLDQGYPASQKFISDHVLIRLKYILDNDLAKDAKSRFQETAQEKFGITPTYKVLSESGPDHNRKFVVGVYIGADKVAEGNGTSKQEAQMSAAAAGLMAKGW
ncbi:MAG: ribonuclease III [Candidatus Kerfeldbacteria bacterium CG08_land_8_20_14_0_20_43_14]|uniref:Ribonuclease 3 n=1 Tax=Candidatus Kerfeldbacteria bacterium CG08_land_8_20_14_0_20_43_14 TaxID=2014246 RepID=A0A2H0YQ25_9BACT|nr:MAG: ribonuclease III [Candidatus Kerfeldbacteria bacterium CG08_land_8_20_14_0_20_43_14]